MKHQHRKCEHKNLKYCPHCDLVYCEDCKREWKREWKKEQSVAWTNGSGTTNNTVPVQWYTESEYFNS